MNAIMELFRENNYEAQFRMTTEIQDERSIQMWFQDRIKITIILKLKTNSEVFLMSGQGNTLKISHGGAFDFTPD